MATAILIISLLLLTEQWFYTRWRQESMTQYEEAESFRREKDWRLVTRILLESEQYDDVIAITTECIGWRREIVSDYYSSEKKIPKAIFGTEQGFKDFCMETAEWYTLRGKAYTALGKFHKGIRDFNSAIGLAPEFVDAYRERAEIMEEMGKRDLAVADYMRILKFVPDDIQAKLKIKALKE